MNRTVFTSFTILCLLFTVFLPGLAFEIQLVKADSGTIYIRADGSIDPPTANITTSDNVTYAFKGNINDSIVVERDNIVVDGAGWTVEGTFDINSKEIPLYIGIDLFRRSNVTVKNINIQGFAYGIKLESSTKSTLTGDNITRNYVGIDCYGSSYNNISDNVIINNVQTFILLADSSNNTILRNIISGNWIGMELVGGNGNVLGGNVIVGSQYNFGVMTTGGVEGFNDIDTSNTVDGKPIYYWTNRKNATVPINAGYVALINCTGITVQNLSLSNNLQDILLAHTTDTKVLNNRLENNWRGIDIELSSNNTVIDNNLANNYDEVIILYASSNNTLYGNEITGTFGDAIMVDHSHYNNFVKNNLTSNGGCIFLHSSTGNNIVGNIMRDSGAGIQIRESSNNLLYHNNLMKNVYQVFDWDVYRVSVNSWDNGYPSGGNYWSDYNGIDSYSGPYQNETGYDWIGDTPYVIDQNNNDRYPLMQPSVFGAEDIGVAYRSLLVKYDELQLELDNLTSTITSLLGNVTDLQTKYTSLSSSIDRMQGQINLLNSTCKTLQESMNDLMITFNSTSDNLKGQISSLNQTCISLSQSLSTLQGQLSSVNSTLQTSINSLNNQVNTILNRQYVFIAIIVILVVAIVYLAIRKPKIKPQT